MFDRRSGAASSLLFATLILAACAQNGGSIASSSGKEIFEGRYIVGYQISEFYPKDDCTGQPYWLANTAHADLNQKLDAIGFFDPAMPNWPHKDGDKARGVHIRFEGNAVSGDTPTYGPSKQYSRQITVTRILDIAPAPSCR